MGVHAAFRQAGGAAGVVERGDVIQLWTVAGRGALAVFQRREKVDGVIGLNLGREQQVGHRDARHAGVQFRQAGAQYLAERAVLAHRPDYGQQLVKAEDDLRAAVLELVSQLQRFAQRADRCIHGATLEDAVEGDVQLRAVGHKHRDPVPGFNPQFVEQGGAAVGQAVQLGPSDAVAVKVQCRLVGLLFRPGAQVLAERLLAVWVVRFTWGVGGPCGGLQAGQVVEVSVFKHDGRASVFLFAGILGSLGGAVELMLMHRYP